MADSTDEKKTLQEKLKGTISEAILKDIEAGREFATDIIPPGSLGRVEETRSGDISSIIERRKQMAEGLTGEESQAARDVASQQIGRATQGQSRALAALQARLGIRGATAGSQQQQVLGEGANRRAEFERELLLANRAAKERGLTNLEASVQDAESGELARETFNLQQLAREKNIELTGGFGFAQLGAAERSALRAGAAINKSGGGGTQIDSGGNIISNTLGAVGGIVGGVAKGIGGIFCFAAGTEIEMEDGSLKKVENIKLGDECAFGGKVYAVGQAVTDDTYEWNNTIVSGTHAILEHGKWIRVHSSLYSKKIGKELVVYPVANEGHLLSVNGQVTADFAEVSDGYNLTEDDRLAILNRVWGELGYEESAN